MTTRFFWIWLTVLALVPASAGVAAAQSGTTQGAPAGQETAPTNPSGTARPASGVPQIDRFYVTPNKKKYAPGTRLQFALKGTANGQAFLTVPGSTDPVPMKEVKPGLYQVAYTVKKNDPAFLKRDVNFRADLKQGENTTIATLKPGGDAVTPSQGVVK
jgi:hypothetical protein